MNIKNKIIKWLGGYTEEDMLHAMNRLNAPINYSRIEKPISVVQARFAIDAQCGKPDSNALETIKNNLCHQVADFMFKYNLLYYDFYYDEITNCYIMCAKAYVREP